MEINIIFLLICQWMHNIIHTTNFETLAIVRVLFIQICIHYITVKWDRLPLKTVHFNPPPHGHNKFELELNTVTSIE